jgi:hypothetical protein
MAALYHVNGSAGLYVGQGTGGSFLGYGGPEGVEIAITDGIADQFSDEYGPFMPSEKLQNGSRARITFELWKSDTAVLNSLLALRDGANVPGGTGQVGRLMLTNGLYFGLTIASPIDAVPWYFPICQIVGDPVSVGLSTQMKVWKLAIDAIKWSPSGPSSAYLYTNSL